MEGPQYQKSKKSFGSVQTIDGAAVGCGIHRLFFVSESTYGLVVGNHVDKEWSFMICYAAVLERIGRSGGPPGLYICRREVAFEDWRIADADAMWGSTN